MFRIAACALIFLTIISLSPACKAESSSDQASQVQTRPDPEKIALIKELLEIRDSRTAIHQTVEQIYALQKLALRNLVEHKLAKTGSLEHAELEETVTEKTNQVFHRYKQLVSENIKMDEEIEEVLVEIFDKYFSRDDVDYMISFYKSSTGKKLTLLNPTLTKETQKSISAELGEKINEIQKQAYEEER